MDPETTVGHRFRLLPVPLLLLLPSFLEGRPPRRGGWSVQGCDLPPVLNDRLLHTMLDSSLPRIRLTLRWSVPTPTPSVNPCVGKEGTVSPAC